MNEEWKLKMYMGCKLVAATPAFNGDGHEGYKVVYAGGYASWAPKDVFEAAYMPVGDDYRVTATMVEDFIVSMQIEKMGAKTTVVCAKLANGFEIVESSGCADPDNYDHKHGARLCVAKIHDKVWMLLGFMLQQAVSSVPAVDEAEIDLEAEQAKDPTGSDEC